MLCDSKISCKTCRYLDIDNMKCTKLNYTYYNLQTNIIDISRLDMINKESLYCINYKAKDDILVIKSELQQLITDCGEFLKINFPELYTLYTEVAILEYNYIPAIFGFFIHYKNTNTISINNKFNWNKYTLYANIMHELLHYKRYKMEGKVVYHDRLFRNLSNKLSKQLKSIDNSFEHIGCGKRFNLTRYGNEYKIMIEEAKHKYNTN